MLMKSTHNQPVIQVNDVAIVLDDKLTTFILENKSGKKLIKEETIK